MGYDNVLKQFHFCKESFILFFLFYRFINKKIKILNVGNFAVVGDIFYVA
jgi:hypothetical protein